jgi:hypothetical protein
MWNQFINIHPILLRAQLPCRFLEFIEQHTIVNSTTAVPQSTTVQADLSTKEVPTSRDTNGKVLGVDVSTCNNDDQNNNIPWESFVVFLLSRWDEGEINRTQLEEIVDLYYNLIDSQQY